MSENFQFNRNWETGSFQMQMPYRSHRELQVWQLSVELAIQIYKLTATFPNNERYGLVSQLQRAATSIPANIAEGHARTTTKDFLHFLTIAFASIAEIDTHLEIAKRMNYMTPESLDEFDLQFEKLARMLQSLRRSLQAKLKDPD